MTFRLLAAHALLTALACALAAPAAGQPWPTRPVRIVVPFAPGGGVDTVTRVLAQKLTDQLGSAFIVDNRPGAAGLLASELVAKAAPDGHTLLTSALEFAINPSVRPKLPYDPLKDFAYISQLTSSQLLLASHPGVPVRTVKQLIALTNARRGELTYGSSGSGGGNHLAAELLQSMTDMRWVHVPFKGAGPSTIALMAGEIDLMLSSTAGLIGPSKAGKVRPLGVTGYKRFAELPDVPTIAEAGVPGYHVTVWYGFYAPAATPTEILRRLHEEARRALLSPESAERLAKTGNEPVASSPDEFAAFVRAEMDKWAKVVKAAQVRLKCIPDAATAACWRCGSDSSFVETERARLTKTGAASR